MDLKKSKNEVFKKLKLRVELNSSVGIVEKLIHELSKGMQLQEEIKRWCEQGVKRHGRQNERIQHIPNRVPEGCIIAYSKYLQFFSWTHAITEFPNHLEVGHGHVTYSS